MKKKILVVNDIVFAGGVEKLIYDLIMRWYEDYDITILSEFKDDTFYDYYPPQVKSMTYGTRISLAHIKGLRKYDERLKKFIIDKKLKRVSDSDFDVVLAMKEGFITKLASQIKGKVKLAWVHLDYKNAYWTYAAFSNGVAELECMKSYKNVICVSEYIRTTIKERIGNPGNLLVRYNPIDEQNIMKLSMESVDDFVKDSNKVYFVSVGRLHYQKGYDLLVKACSILNYHDFKDAYQVLIIGEGEQEHELKQLVKKQGVENILFLGYRENPYKYLKLADWFISSSRYEGYSLVSQEAAILDVPIIATRVSGVNELLGNDAKYGIVNDISAEGIAKSMMSVLENSSLHSQYKKLISERKSIINFDERLKAITELFEL